MKQNAEIAKHLDESLAAQNKLYEANCEHTRELYKIQKTKLQEQLQIAQACEYLILFLTILLQ